MRHDTPEALARDFHDGVDDVGDALRHAGRRVASDLTATSRTWTKRAVAAAKAKPAQTLAVGAAAVALLAFALRRSGRR